MSQRRHLAVVPAYNESATIARVIDAIHRDAPDYDILVIDDGSTDETSPIARAAGARVARLPYNLGIGGAVQAGFVYANEHGYDYVAQVDGDGQHDPGEIGRLIEPLLDGRADLVVGTRFAEGGGYRGTPARRLGIRFFAAVVSMLMRQRVTDTTSGFRAANKDAIRLFATDYPHDYPEVEAVLMLHHHRLSMREVPVRMYSRGGGLSSISNGKSAYYMIKVLLALGVGLARKRPVTEPGEPAPVAASHGI